MTPKARIAHKRAVKEAKHRNAIARSDPNAFPVFTRSKYVPHVGKKQLAKMEGAK